MSKAPFSQKEYDKYNGPACDASKEILRLWYPDCTIIDDRGMGIDLIVLEKGQFLCAVDAAVRKDWQEEALPYIWCNILDIVENKDKYWTSYIDKDSWLFIFNIALDSCFTILGRDIVPHPVFEKWCRHDGKRFLDTFHRVPADHGVFLYKKYGWLSEGAVQ